VHEGELSEAAERERRRERLREWLIFSSLVLVAMCAVGTVFGDDIAQLVTGEREKTEDQAAR
jgi:hypothetical protein